MGAGLKGGEAPASKQAPLPAQPKWPEAASRHEVSWAWLGEVEGCVCSLLGQQCCLEPVSCGFPGWSPPHLGGGDVSNFLD